MTIDYDKFKDEAARTGVSAFTLVKRHCGYGKNVGRGMCKNCEHICIPSFKGEQRMQCYLIGVGIDPCADVKPTWSCKGFALRDEQLKVVSDFLKNYKE